MQNNLKVESKTIDHLGLISAMCDEIGVVEVIDSIIPPDVREILTTGECVKIMNINALGFTGQGLYLTGDFFRNKATEALIKPGITPEQINDDALGRALDAIYDANPALIFARVAFRAAKHLGVDLNEGVHIDTTSKVMFGSYDGDDSENPKIVTHGYSKDKRPDLLQIMFSIIVSNDGGFPLLGQILPGNTSDSTHFREAVKTLKDNLQLGDDDDIMLIGDSKLYNETTIREAQTIKWISRVPETIKETRQTLKWAQQQNMTNISEKYSYIETISNYGGIKQRWLVVQSQEALERAVNTIARAIKKEKEDFEARLKKFNSKGFSCENDAKKTLKKETKKLKYHLLGLQEITAKENYLRQGKPKPNDPKERTYYIVAELLEDVPKKENAIKLKSLFIIATNELDTKKLTSLGLLNKYKDQSKVENRIRFLKNPLCMAPAIYLKNQSRIEALGAVMLISLLIFVALEYLLRKRLAQENETIPNQVKKPTNKPTTRWVFQLFEGISVVTFTVDGQTYKEAANLNEINKKILRLLGRTFEQKYFLV